MAGWLPLFAPASTNLRRMQIGLQGLNYFTGFSPFLNWWFQAAPPTVHLAAGGTLSGPTCWNTSNASGAPFFDATTGDVIMPFNSAMSGFHRLLYTPGVAADVMAAMQAGGYTTQTMVAYCHADWTIHVDNCGTNGGVVSGQDTNQCVFTIGDSTDAQPQITISAVGTPTHPPTPRVCKQAFKSRLDGGEEFDPDWLAIVAPFGSRRAMDWLQTNGSHCVDYTQMAPTGYQLRGFPIPTVSGSPEDWGYAGGMPVATVANLANAAAGEIHYCLPGVASDACVASIATALKAGTNQIILFELGNECSWRSGVNNYTNDYLAAQALLMPGNPWGADDAGTRAMKFYGYRSAQMMKIVSDTYANRARWRGGLATQSVNPAVTDNILVGVHYYLTNVASGAAITTLFDCILGTSYMGEPFGWQYPTNCTKANPALVTMPGHDKVNGDLVKFFVGTGMTQLNNVTATVSNANQGAGTFNINVDTSGFTTWSPTSADASNTCWKGLLWQMMDDSEALHISTPGTYPTKYTYFNQQMAKAIQFGVNDVGYTVASVYSLAGQNDPVTGSWKLQKDRCIAEGLTLEQYEGGPNFFPGPALDGTMSPQFNEYFLNFIWSEEMAAVMYATYVAFATWGNRSAKFTEGGNMGIHNPWPGMRSVPQDTSNPQWQAILAWNNGP